MTHFRMACCMVNLWLRWRKKKEAKRGPVITRASFPRPFFQQRLRRSLFAVPFMQQQLETLLHLPSFLSPRMFPPTSPELCLWDREGRPHSELSAERTVFQPAAGSGPGKKKKKERQREKIGNTRLGRCERPRQSDRSWLHCVRRVPRCNYSSRLHPDADP